MYNLPVDGRRVVYRSKHKEFQCEVCFQAIRVTYYPEVEVEKNDDSEVLGVQAPVSPLPIE